MVAQSSGNRNDVIASDLGGIIQSFGLRVGNVRCRDINNGSTSGIAEKRSNKTYHNEKRSEGDGAEYSPQSHFGEKVGMLLPKKKIEEHFEGDKIIHQNAVTSQHNTQRKITQKQQKSTEKGDDQLSDENIRRLHNMIKRPMSTESEQLFNAQKMITEKQQMSHEISRRRLKMIERQMTHLKIYMDEHKKRAAEHREMMSELAQLFARNEGKRQYFPELDIQTREYKIPQVDDHQQPGNDRQEIQRKIEEYEAICRKIHDYSEKAKQLIQEMESLNKKITDSEVNTQQRKLEIENRFEEIQQMKKQLNDSTRANDMVEFQDDIEELHEDVEKLAERFQNLKKTVHDWKLKNSCFEDTVRKLEDNMSLRDQKAPDIEEHINFLNLMVEIQKKMVEYKEKISRCINSKNLRKQQKEELSNHLRTHVQKMDDQQATFTTAFKGLQEELEKAKGRNINVGNINIKPRIEDIERKVKGIEELVSRIEKDRKEINEYERRLVAWDSEIEQKCKEIICPEISSYKKEHMIELNDLCTKLDKWNTEYERFEVQHDQWLKEKKQLEEKVIAVEHKTAKLVKQPTSIDKDITCLNRMIDTKDKMIGLKKMVAKLIDLEKQKKDTDKMWIDYMQKMGQDTRDAAELERIIKFLRETKNFFDTVPKQQRWDTLKNSSNQPQIIQGQALWSSFLEVIASDSSRMNDFITEACKGTKTLDFNFELMGPSNVAFSHEKERIEEWAAQIEKKYEEVKQKNEKLSGDNKATYIESYMEKIEHLFQEISICENDSAKTVSAWTKKKDILENNTKVLADKIKSQYKFLCNMNKRSYCFNFMFYRDEWMVKYKKSIMKFTNQTKEVFKRWDTDRNEYGQKFDRLSKNKDEMIEILNANQKHLSRREQMNQHYDYIEQESGRKEVAPYHKGHKEEANRDVEEEFRTISHLTETAHILMGVRIAIVETFINPLDDLAWTRYNQAIRPLHPSKEDIEMRLKEIDLLLDAMLTNEQNMRIAEELLQGWEINMNKLEGKAKTLVLNPLNIQIDGFQQVKDECLTMMSQHEANTRDHETKGSNHVRDNKEYLKKLGKLNKWIHSMPHDAIKLFKEVQDSAQDTVESTRKLSDINEIIEYCQKETNGIDRKIRDLWNKMAYIEWMTENPSVFAIESMTPKNITRVFSEIKKWNEMYESLKEAIGHSEDQKMELEESMTQWETIVHKKCDGKLRDTSMHTALSVL